MASVVTPGSQCAHENICVSVLSRLKQSIMPTSPVKTRIPLTSFGHLITEVKRQLFGVDAPTSVELTGWRKFFNSYTLQGRRNCVLATYGILVVTAAAYVIHRQKKNKNLTPPSTG